MLEKAQSAAFSGRSWLFFETRKKTTALAGRGAVFERDFPLELELADLVLELRQLFTLGAGQSAVAAAVAAAGVTIGLFDPAADRPDRASKFFAQLHRFPPGSYQLDHLLPKLRRISLGMLGL
jgi:hypothetical protein